MTLINHPLVVSFQGTLTEHQQAHLSHVNLSGLPSSILSCGFEWAPIAREARDVAFVLGVFTSCTTAHFSTIHE